MPQVAAWHRKYAERGLVIIGNHAPEFDYEKDVENVRRANRRLGIEFPVCLDNDFANWNAYKNRYWPTKYLIDKQGIVRYVRIGEGGYVEIERLIEQLLTEA